MNDSMRSRGRSAIYLMGGFYLIYMAYQVFKNRADSSGGEYIAVMAGAAAFLVIGIAMMGFALYNFYKTGKEIHEVLEQRELEREAEEFLEEAEEFEEAEEDDAETLDIS